MWLNFSWPLVSQSPFGNTHYCTLYIFTVIIFCLNFAIHVYWAFEDNKFIYYFSPYLQVNSQMAWRKRRRKNLHNHIGGNTDRNFNIIDDEADFDEMLNERIKRFKTNAGPEDTSTFYNSTTTTTRKPIIKKRPKKKDTPLLNQIMPLVMQKMSDVKKANSIVISKPNPVKTNKAAVPWIFQRPSESSINTLSSSERDWTIFNLIKRNIARLGRKRRRRRR